MAAKKSVFFFIFSLSYVWNSVNISVCLPVGKRKPPVGTGFSGEPQVFVSAATRVRIPVSCRQGPSSMPQQFLGRGQVTIL